MQLNSTQQGIFSFVLAQPSQGDNAQDFNDPRVEKENGIGVFSKALEKTVSDKQELEDKTQANKNFSLSKEQDNEVDENLFLLNQQFINPIVFQISGKDNNSEKFSQMISNFSDINKTHTPVNSNSLFLILGNAENNNNLFENLEEKELLNSFDNKGNNFVINYKEGVLGLGKQTPIQDTDNKGLLNIPDVAINSPNKILNKNELLVSNTLNKLEAIEINDKNVNFIVDDKTTSPKKLENSFFNINKNSLLSYPLKIFENNGFFFDENGFIKNLNTTNDFGENQTLISEKNSLLEKILQNLNNRFQPSFLKNSESIENGLKANSQLNMNILPVNKSDNSLTEKSFSPFGQSILQYSIVQKNNLSKNSSDNNVIRNEIEFYKNSQDKNEFNENILLNLNEVDIEKIKEKQDISYGVNNLQKNSDKFKISESMQENLNKDKKIIELLKSENNGKNIEKNKLNTIRDKGSDLPFFMQPQYETKQENKSLEEKNLQESKAIIFEKGIQAQSGTPIIVSEKSSADYSNPIVSAATRRAIDLSSQLQARGGGSAKIQIQDDKVGQIELNIHMKKDNTVVMEVKTSDNEIKNILEKNSDTLKKSLDVQNITLTDFKVLTMDKSHQAGMTSMGQGSSNNQSQQNWQNFNFNQQDSNQQGLSQGFLANYSGNGNNQYFKNNELETSMNKYSNQSFLNKSLGNKNVEKNSITNIQRGANGSIKVLV